MDHDAPVWFRRALDAEVEDRTVVVDGCPVHYLRWGRDDQPGLVMVHGGAAHAHWWAHIAPLLGSEYAVAAIDLSGHGDSGRRDRYDLTSWCHEVMAVADHAAFAGRPILVGHSMGGFVSIATAANHPEGPAGIVILDSPVVRQDPEVEAGSRGMDFRDPKTYPDVATAVARFRTVPPQDHYEPYILENVAKRSLRPVDGGWTWKFDPAIFLPTRRDAADMLPEVRCRVALFRSQHGLVTPDIGDFMYEQLGRVAPVIELPEAGHHPMLDVPLLLVTGLRTLLADWEHSIPRRRGAAGT